MKKQSRKVIVPGDFITLVPEHVRADWKEKNGTGPFPVVNIEKIATCSRTYKMSFRVGAMISNIVTSLPWAKSKDHECLINEVLVAKIKYE